MACHPQSIPNVALINCGFGVGLLLLYPFNQLEAFVAEQDKSQKAQHKALAQTWGGAQSIVPPVLVLPYTEHFTSIDTITDNSGEIESLAKIFLMTVLQFYCPKA